MKHNIQNQTLYRKDFKLLLQLMDLGFKKQKNNNNIQMVIGFVTGVNLYPKFPVIQTSKHKHITNKK